MNTEEIDGMLKKSIECNRKAALENFCGIAEKALGHEPSEQEREEAERLMDAIVDHCARRTYAVTNDGDIAGLIANAVDNVRYLKVILGDCGTPGGYRFWRDLLCGD